MEEADTNVVDMGYEECQPMPRRGSMSHEEECQRRASIKAIMADHTISPMAKRRSIQHLMDGRRNSINGGASVQSVSSAHSSRSSTGSTCSETPDLDYAESYGYGYENPENGIGGAAGLSSHYYAISNEHTRRTEQQRPQCSHYERNCTLIAPCCGAAFGCRICHDDCPVLPPKINNGGRRYHRSASLPSSFTSMPGSGGAPNVSPDGDDTHHTIDRFAVREVICRECYTRQSSKT